mmetsp:Transcript_13837/g.29981  ORF Transcript_13837/g.29981 Transcript_13837/m.29981 type:complete len:259 (+) Transcript_13837:380-1156(+)
MHYLNQLPAVTYEGDKIVMALQVARYLLAQHAKISADEPVPSGVAYLSHASPPATVDAADPHCLVALWEAAARAAVSRAAHQVHSKVKQGHDVAVANREAQLGLIEAAYAHCIMTLVRGFAEECRRIEDGPVRAALTRLCCLFALYQLREHGSVAVWSTILSPEQLRAVDDAVPTLLAAIRPDAVALTDAFKFSDKHLQSCLGGYDGHVYEQVYDWAKRSPLNTPHFVSTIGDLLQPYLDQTYLAKGKALQRSVRSKL